MRRRIFIVSALAVIAAAVLLIVFVMQRKLPPRSVGLLPPADAIFYLNINIVRRAGAFAALAGVTREAEYEDFVRQTGFQFERDLDEAAFAVHAPHAPAGSRVIPNEDNRFSEIFSGKWDEDRVRAWLQRRTATTEEHRGTTIFAIPHEGRTVRVALLDRTTAAVSNTESSDAIHAMIDRRHDAAGLSPLVEHYYREVPYGSLAWLIATVAPAPETGVQSLVPTTGGIASPSWLRDIAGGTVLVASLRFVTSLQLRAEAIADSPARAQQVAENANAWLAVFRTLEQGVELKGFDADVKTVFASLTITQESDRAVVQAQIPIGALRKLAIGEAAAEAPSAPKK